MPADAEQAELEAPTSLRASLEAGFAAAEAAAPPVEVVTAPAEPVTAPAQVDPAAPAVARDEAGRFAPKAEDTPDKTAAAAPEAKPAPVDPKITDKPEAASPEAPQEPIRAPAALSAVAKAKWATLDPVLQAEWSKRERDMDQGLQKQGVQLKRFERMDEAIAPHRDRLLMSGMDEVAYVRSLITADEMLRGPNKIQALAQIAEMYGADLRQLGQPGQQPQQAQLPPQFQAMASEIANLKGELAQFKGAAQEADIAQTQARIDTFAKDHPYFENVRPLMAALIQSGQAIELEDAYAMACRASPEVHPVLLKEQMDAQAAAARAEATARANEAKQASGSVTGSPAPGTVAARSGPPLSTRDSLERGFRDAGLIA